MTKIYVVIGDTGEYSAYRQWMVCAYANEEAAKARVIELETLMKTVGIVSDSDFDNLVAVVGAMRKHEHGDKNFQIDYTGTRYGYESVELKDA